MAAVSALLASQNSINSSPPFLSFLTFAIPQFSLHLLSSALKAFSGSYQTTHGILQIIRKQY
jgi:hypothetical protein